MYIVAWKGVSIHTKFRKATVGNKRSGQHIILGYATDHNVLLYEAKLQNCVESCKQND